MEDHYARVLIVDDDTSILTVLKTLLERQGFDVVTASSSDRAYNILREDEFDLMLSDIVMEPFDGITLLQQARKLNPETQVIMMTGFATIETATKAMKLGAFDYICKPFKINELQSTIDRAIEYIDTMQGQDEGDPEPQKKISLVKKHFNEIVGSSDLMTSVYKLVKELALGNQPILIQGESGVGKSLIGNALHTSSPRASGSMLTFNCAICPESFVDAILFGYVEMPTDDEGNVIKGLPVVRKGVFENAKGGTVVFEEIAALPLHYQEELVHTLTKGTIRRTGSEKDVTVDVRVIADSSIALDDKVKNGEFLEALFNLFQNKIVLPSINERKEDISSLISYFILQYNKENKTSVTFDKRALAAMEKYCWPGNVRELKSAVFRAARLCKNQKVQLANVSTPIRMCYMREKSSIFGYSDEFDLRWRSLKKFIKAKEREYVDQVLKVTKGDREKAAKMMGITLAAFYRKYG